MGSGEAEAAVQLVGPCRPEADKQRGQPCWRYRRTALIRGGRSLEVTRDAIGCSFDGSVVCLGVLGGAGCVLVVSVQVPQVTGSPAWWPEALAVRCWRPDDLRSWSLGGPDAANPLRAASR